MTGGQVVAGECLPDLYNTTSFNSGSYDAIRHQGDLVINKDRYPVPVYGR